MLGLLASWAFGTLDEMALVLAPPLLFLFYSVPMVGRERNPEAVFAVLGSADLGERAIS